MVILNKHRRIFDKPKVLVLDYTPSTFLIYIPVITVILFSADFLFGLIHLNETFQFVSVIASISSFPLLWKYPYSRWELKDHTLLFIGLNVFGLQLPHPKPIALKRDDFKLEIATRPLTVSNHQGGRHALILKQSAGRSYRIAFANSQKLIEQAIEDLNRLKS